MSVDTYLKGKDTGGYMRVRDAGIDVLVAPALTRLVEGLSLRARGALFWRSLRVAVAHEHGPT